MFIRTFTRTFINKIVKNNFVFMILKNIVNFYYKIIFKRDNNLRFQFSSPITRVEKKENISFLSVTGDKIDCK